MKTFDEWFASEEFDNVCDTVNDRILDNCDTNEIIKTIVELMRRAYEESATYNAKIELIGADEGDMSPQEITEIVYGILNQTVVPTEKKLAEALQTTSLRLLATEETMGHLQDKIDLLKDGLELNSEMIKDIKYEIREAKKSKTDTTGTEKGKSGNRKRSSGENS